MIEPSIGVRAISSPRVRSRSSPRARSGAETSITPGTGAAVVTAAMDREVSDGVTTISERGVVTLVLRAEAESWVVVAEHYSFPPQSP